MKSKRKHVTRNSAAPVSVPQQTPPAPVSPSALPPEAAAVQSEPLVWEPAATTSSHFENPGSELQLQTELPGNRRKAELQTPSAPFPTGSQPVEPATGSKIKAATTWDAPAPAPLVSLAAALAGVKLEIPATLPPPSSDTTAELPGTKPTDVSSGQNKLPSPQASPTPSLQEGEKTSRAVRECAPLPPTMVAAPVIARAPVGEAKVSEKNPPAAPVTAKVSEPVVIPKTRPVEPVTPPAPAPKISEEEIVKDLPALQPPEPQPATRKSAPTNTPVTPVRAIAPMFVVMITPELAPVAKVGGLGDVTLGLARELELRGNAVEIILPKYDCMRYHHIWGLKKAYEHLQVPWFGGVIDTTVWFGLVHGRKCYFIDPHSPDNFFNRGAFYGQHDDLMRFAFFCRAAMEFLFKSGKQPDILHCHDWQTALVPVLLWEMYQHLGMRHPRVCFTIHNFKHQGLASEHVLRATGLNRPEHFFNYERLRDNHNPQVLNLMKGGIVYSNFVTTVSPRHAWEAKDGGQAFGLEPTLHTHHSKYGGVLNGLDYEMFNPEKDPHIPSHYTAQTVERKYENKRVLRRRLWLADNAKPIVAFIGRLDPQKGPELVRHAIFYALSHGAQFVLLGESPDKTINEHFWGLKRYLNDNPDCHLEIGYSDELAHLIYAGADMMVVPSRFEPCGLTQLISLRYGTVPIVRSVGGLADTVFDKDHSHRPLHERNGYVFHEASDAGLESALHRALGCYYQFPDHFRNLMLNGMKADYSWNHPGQHYLNIYDYIREK